MEIHKPKPFHNWREFLKEYAIIVLGVVTALAAEQIVEGLHWREQVREARHAIATELAGDVAGAITRLRIENCAERRLDSLAAILDGAAKGGNLPPVGDTGVPPRRLFTRGAWDSVVASQTAAHFPAGQLAELSLTYNTVERIALFAGQETAAWDDLYAMVGPGRRLDPASEAALRQALSHARASNRYMASLSATLVARVKNHALAFSPTDLAMISAAAHESLTGPNSAGRDVNPPSIICGPLGAVPASYGQAQESAIPARVEEIVKALPQFGP
ncbi:MAG: hypothetical protein JO256_12070 [Alphaproteobacteria bacterium]|nr:hypothetical protein [Alphaproteobacteria bacterium]